jgi:hypothetical protein
MLLLFNGYTPLRTFVQLLGTSDGLVSAIRALGVAGFIAPVEAARDRAGRLQFFTEGMGKSVGQAALTRASSVDPRGDP